MLRDQMREFIIDQLMMGMDAESLDDSGSLMDKGILDSVGVLDLVGFLEQTWSIDIADDELIRENLDSIDNLVGFVQRKVA